MTAAVSSFVGSNSLTVNPSSHASCPVVFERYRDADAALEHFSNIGHLMEPIMATASVTGEVLGTPNAKMKEQLGKGGPKLFTPWMALQDQELAQED